MTQNRNIVWVLGSGFSVPLGGPTLTSLLSPTSKILVKTIFTEKNYPNLYEKGYFDKAYAAFTLGYSDPNKRVPQMWIDAEQYLDYLDTAVAYPKSPAAARLDPIFYIISPLKKIDAKPLVDTTRRIIAAECSVFLEGTYIKLEKWEPYIRWAKMLDSNHTIITFNYDRVLEILSEKSDIEGIGSNSFFGLSDHDAQKAKEVQNIATVLKLHGSVDWQKDSSQPSNLCRYFNPYAALKCDDNQLIIATPGPTKRLMVNDYLAPLWNEAEKALNQANAVFFVGYRFPPTDAEARGRLLGALMKNESPDLRLFTVLGPDDNADNRRLEALLRYATKNKAEVTRLPLWAQDFMSVYDPDFIFE